MKKLPQSSEHEIQSAFIEYVQMKYGNSGSNGFLAALSYAALNEIWVRGEDDKGKQALLNKYKEQGLSKGIPDYHYDQPRGGYTKLVIEFKTEKRRNTKNGGLSDEQIEYLAAIEPYACVNVCYTIDEAVVVFDDYMELDPTGCSAEDGMIKEDEKLKGILGNYEKPLDTD